MNINDILSQITAGGIVSVLVIILSLIEITPIKVSPLQWIGRRINKETIEKVEKIEKKVEQLEDKMDEHTAQSYRTKIMNFQNQLLKDGIGGHTQEAWLEVILASEAYEKYVKDNNIQNGMCTFAIDYIKESYKKCLKTRDFANLPKGN